MFKSRTWKLCLFRQQNLQVSPLLINTINSENYLVVLTLTVLMRTDMFLMELIVVLGQLIFSYNNNSVIIYIHRGICIPRDETNPSITECKNFCEQNDLITCHCTGGCGLFLT